MSDKPENPAAFPSDLPWDKDDPQSPRFFEPGMSLRDYFAGQALAGFAATSADHGIPAQEHASRWSRAAYFLADAMLAERAKP